VSGGGTDAGNFAYGIAGDLPVTGDWNAMGHAGIGVYRAVDLHLLPAQ